ncbi:hypothetical protein ACJX0J_006936, partial [Zea mays]
HMDKIAGSETDGFGARDIKYMTNAHSCASGKEKKGAEKFKLASPTSENRIQQATQGETCQAQEVGFPESFFTAIDTIPLLISLQESHSSFSRYIIFAMYMIHIKFHNGDSRFAAAAATALS